MEKPLARVSGVVSFATVPEMTLFMNAPPHTISAMMGIMPYCRLLSSKPVNFVVSLYSTNPADSNQVGYKANPMYPQVSSANAHSMELRKPILSANAPAKVGSRYRHAENTPAMVAD